MAQKIETAKVQSPKPSGQYPSVTGKLDIKGEFQHNTPPQKSPSEQNLEVVSDGDEAVNPSLGSRFA